VADRERFIPKAAAATRSSKYVAFRNGDEPDELLRDVVALANAGGGAIITQDAPDLAWIQDELDFADLELATVDRGSVLVVGPAGEAPLTVEGGPYFRHGAKSVPATRDDLRRFMDRRVTQVKRKLLGDIKRVITAPEGSEVVAIERSEDDAGERVIRITTDEHAPVYRAVDFDVTHPYRQKELIAEVNRRLPDHRAINAYEFQAIKRTKDIDPDFVHRPRFGTNQYSEAFVEWLVEQIRRDGEFVASARARYYELRRVSDSRSRG
jgi:hypothetical protein